MKKQVCVIGVGRFGAAVAQELYQSGHDVMALDNDEARFRKCWVRSLTRCVRMLPTSRY